MNSKFDKIIQESLNHPLLKEKYTSEEDIPEEFRVPEGDFAIITGYRYWKDENKEVRVDWLENEEATTELRHDIYSFGLVVDIPLLGHYHERGELVEEIAYFVKRREGIEVEDFKDFLMKEMKKFDQDYVTMRLGDSDFYQYYGKEANGNLVGDEVEIGDRITYDREEYEQLDGWSNFAQNPDYGFGFTY